jgi:flavodoxin
MKNLIVYSSRTGNTRKIAEAILTVMPEGTALFPVENAPDPSDYDFVALGFWVDKGAPDCAMLKYMGQIREKNVGLFATLGAWPNSEHALDCMKKATNLLSGSRVLGTFICQGKIDPELLATMEKMGKNSPHPMTEERKTRIAEAAKHPNEADCEAARKVFADIALQLGKSNQI